MGSQQALSALPQSGSASLKGRMAVATIPCECCAGEVAADTPHQLAQVPLTCSWRVSTSL